MTSLLRRHAVWLVAWLLMIQTNAAGASTSLQWSRLHPKVSPSARTYPAEAFDPKLHGIVVFGGVTSAREYLADTWLWRSGRWHQLHPATSPPARTDPGMAYDRATGELVLFGGYDGSTWLGDTWTFDGTTWQRALTTTTASPPPATGPSLFPDPISRHVDEYGGYDGQFYQLQTWRWTGSGWRRLHPKHSAWARSNAVAVLDRPRHQVVLFGGLGDVNPDNTWTWDGHDWRMRHPSAQPANRYGAAAAYDPALRRVVVFGGGSGGGFVGDTWTWDGKTWTHEPTEGAPPAREGARMASLPSTDRLVLFGGQNATGALSDTWALDAS